MSRSLSIGDKEFIDNFPLGVSICGCYLKKIHVKNVVKDDGVTYDSIIFYFYHKKTNKWISKIINVYPKTHFKDIPSFRANRKHIITTLENILACYISGGHIKHLLLQTKASGAVNLIEDIKEVLTEKKFWLKEVCLKTIPSKNGYTNIAKFPPFMSTPENTRWLLSYSKWEIEQMALLKINK